MPTFASELSNDQLTHLAQKSVLRASRKYGADFMLAALDEIDGLSDLQRRRLVEMPDFGEAVASRYGAYLFFTGGEWQRWIESQGSTPPIIESTTPRNSLGVKLVRKLGKLKTVIAKNARELGIVTIGVVTKPFHFEGQRVCALSKQASRN